MELDDLKPAWQRLEQELETQKRITARLMAEQTSSRLQASLKPLLNWQSFQIVAGIVLATLGAQVWLAHRHDTLTFVSGLIVHAYAIALIIGGARTVQLLLDIDYAAPVVTLQKRIAKLDKSYVRSGWILGLPWWLLWIPFGIVLLSKIGVDLSGVPIGAWLPANIVVGLLGMLLTVAAFHWAKRSTKPGTGRRLERMVSGASIDNAKRLLAGVEEFERDAG